MSRPRRKIEDPTSHNVVRRGVRWEPGARWLLVRARGLAELPHKEDTREQGLIPKRKRKRHTGSGTKPTPAQVEEERSCALLEITQLTSNPFATLRESPGSDSERRDHSDSGSSNLGPPLTP
ncbi:hypothetical protein NDU88_001200 [Pleurodeles waltl]|uniref:Uncharacterized protein n=1 Tax=Pleurodeles waltl TaxID=8319 RepID=A0AAV7ML37_PLEWA|nr:hypothetical protein NDU88_001200 [Pleurodeles waltl]